MICDIIIQMTYTCVLIMGLGPCESLTSQFRWLICQRMIGQHARISLSSLSSDRDTSLRADSASCENHNRPHELFKHSSVLRIYETFCLGMRAGVTKQSNRVSTVHPKLSILP